jgi:hypothetical protein
MVLQRPSGFIEPCLPSKVDRPPSGTLWVHEIKHDGYRLMVRRDGSRIRCLRSKRRGHEASLLFAFDLLQHDGADLRDLPLIERKRRLDRLLGRAVRQTIHFNEHLTGDGPTVFDHVCRMGPGRHRVQAGGRALSRWAIQDVAEVEEPSERGGAAGARGRVALTLSEPTRETSMSLIPLPPIHDPLPSPAPRPAACLAGGGGSRRWR